MSKIFKQIPQFLTAAVAAGTLAFSNPSKTLGQEHAPDLNLTEARIEKLLNPQDAVAINLLKQILNHPQDAAQANFARAYRPEIEKVLNTVKVTSKTPARFKETTQNKIQEARVQVKTNPNNLNLSIPKSKSTEKAKTEPTSSKEYQDFQKKCNLTGNIVNIETKTLTTYPGEMAKVVTIGNINQILKPGIYNILRIEGNNTTLLNIETNKKTNVPSSKLPSSLVSGNQICVAKSVEPI
jgi:hypothetical protein